MATLVEEKVVPLTSGEAIVFGTITMDSSYATGGEAIDAPGDAGYHDLAIAGGSLSGYVGVWDKANQKIVAFRVGAAVATPLEQPAAAADLSAVSFRFIGFRPA